MQTEQKPLILTLRLDTKSQAFFDEQRARYFPRERNFLKAHLTLFHQLPEQPHTYDDLGHLSEETFQMMVTGLRHLGAGVGYEIESTKLMDLHQRLRSYFHGYLIP